MDCEKALDIIYEYSGDPQTTPPMPFLSHLQVSWHLMFCPDCAYEYEQLELSRDMLRSDFFPASPGLEDSVMATLSAEESAAMAAKNAEFTPVPGGLSTKGWVIAGIVVLISLATAFFGLDFHKVVLAEGDSFLLPFGIVLGTVVTGYGALFIGSHLKELRERFGLQAK